MPRSVKRPSPLSIRLSEAERAQLEMAAGSGSLAGYVKAALFASTPRPHVRQRTQRDTVLIAQLLAVLGRSRIAANLAELATAARSGSLEMSEETSANLYQACDDIRLVHNALMRALGKEERAPSIHELHVRPAFDAASNSPGSAP